MTDPSQNKKGLWQIARDSWEYRNLPRDIRVEQRREDLREWWANTNVQEWISRIGSKEVEGEADDTREKMGLLFRLLGANPEQAASIRRLIELTGADKSPVEHSFTKDVAHAIGDAAKRTGTKIQEVRAERKEMKAIARGMKGVPQTTAEQDQPAPPSPETVHGGPRFGEVIFRMEVIKDPEAVAAFELIDTLRNLFAQHREHEGDPDNSLLEQLHLNPDDVEHALQCMLRIKEVGTLRAHVSSGLKTSEIVLREIMGVNDFKTVTPAFFSTEDRFGKLREAGKYFQELIGTTKNVRILSNYLKTHSKTLQELRSELENDPNLIQTMSKKRDEISLEKNNLEAEYQTKNRGDLDQDAFDELEAIDDKITNLIREEKLANQNLEAMRALKTLKLDSGDTQPRLNVCPTGISMSELMKQLGVAPRDKPDYPLADIRSDLNTKFYLELLSELPHILYRQRRDNSNEAQQLRDVINKIDENDSTLANRFCLKKDDPIELTLWRNVEHLSHDDPEELKEAIADLFKEAGPHMPPPGNDKGTVMRYLLDSGKTPATLQGELDLIDDLESRKADLEAKPDKTDDDNEEIALIEAHLSALQAFKRLTENEALRAKRKIPDDYPWNDLSNPKHANFNIALEALKGLCADGLTDAMVERLNELDSDGRLGKDLRNKVSIPGIPDVFGIPALIIHHFEEITLEPPYDDSLMALREKIIEIADALMDIEEDE